DALTKKWRDWTESVTGRGRLDLFFQRSARSAATWGHIMRDFLIGLINIFKGSSRAGQTLSESLARAAAQFRKFTESARGKNDIKKFFNDAVPAVQAIAKLAGALGGVFLKLGQNPGLSKFVDQIRTEVLPAIAKLFGVITK